MRAATATGRRSLPRAADVVRHAAGLAGGRVRRLSPRLRRRLLLLVAVLVVLAATYAFWFRDSSLVRVEHVTVTGLTGTDAHHERVAVTEAARRMTTLHLDEAALLQALGPGAAVQALHVSSNFPHGLRIEVVETAPVAVLVQGSTRVAVGAGGVLLPHVRVSAVSAPAIVVGSFPSHSRLGRGRALQLVTCAAAIPVGLRPRVMRIRQLPGTGLVAYLRRGPRVVLGSAAALPAKWAAVAAVLADGSSRGASYVDVRLPERPVAGGLDVPPPPASDQGQGPAAPGPAAVPGTAGPTGSTGATVSPQATAPGAAQSSGAAPNP